MPFKGDCAEIKRVHTSTGVRFEHRMFSILLPSFLSLRQPAVLSQPGYVSPGSPANQPRDLQSFLA